jgi:AraC-like DNA-binding protein
LNEHDNPQPAGAHLDVDAGPPREHAGPRTAMPADTRGILDPAEMMRLVAFDRSPTGEALQGIVEWCWSVAWDLPDGRTHDQEVLSHPAGNVSIGTVDAEGVVHDPAVGRVYGVVTGVSRRHLAGRGWTVAARTSVGGLGALLGAPASTATDRQLTLAEALVGLDSDRVVAAVRERADNAERTRVLHDALAELVVERRDPTLLAEARQVVQVAALAEHDRSVCRVEQLATAAGVSVRTLQRQFDTHVGVSPSFVIRRWRLIDAAEAARAAIDAAADGAEPDWRGWAQVAAELGYADQAHLTRDFRRHLGTSPGEYLARTTAGGRPGSDARPEGVE